MDAHRDAHQYMIRHLVVFTVMVGLLLGSGLIYAGSYIATFDGLPLTPQRFSTHFQYPDFDVQIHHREPNGSMTVQNNAQHGGDCSGPPATHVAGSNASDHVYICRDHVMTALNEGDGPNGGYGAIYLTPNRMVDFSTTGTVSFELSTARLSKRDWWDLTVSPFQDSQSLPLLSNLSQGVDLQGPNRNAIVVTIDNFEAAPSLKIVRNGVVTVLADFRIPFNSGITAGTNEAAVRQTFKLSLGGNRAKFERIGSLTATPITFFDTALPALAWSQGVVNFGHHSYSPSKDNSGVAATWHWDQFQIDPAVPFYIGHFNSRGTGGGTITADLPAPPGSYLRFSAICRPIIDGVMPPKMTDTGHAEHFSSYLMPIAAGKKSFNVTFAADDWYNAGYGCYAKDYSIFALGGPSSTPTPIPTASPTPIPTATPSPSPTPSPTPVPTPTPSPQTYSCVRSDGVIVWQGDPGGRTCP